MILYLMRGIPSKKYQEYLLEKQNNKCYWCNVELDSYWLRPDGVIKHLMPVWDHYLPYAFTGSSSNSEFVASCQMCNSHKHSKMIASPEHEQDMKDYLTKKSPILKWINLDSTISDNGLSERQERFRQIFPCLCIQNALTGLYDAL